MRLSKLSITLMLIAALLIGAGGMYVGMAGFSKMSGESPSSIQDEPNAEQGDTGGEAQKASFDKVREAFHVIANNYYRKVDEEKLLNGAIRGMVQALDDPFSVYMNPETARKFSQSLSSSYQGIGAKVSMVNGKVTIVSPFKGSPAEEAGLRPNDKIIAINGESIEDLSLYEAVLKIRGKQGTTVTLGIRRKGVPDLLEIEVTRDNIPIQTIYKDSVKKNGHLYGIIEITSFSRGTADEFQKALSALEDKGIDGLVIDVRGNPGGYLGSVTRIADFIVPDTKPVVQTVERNGHTTRFFSSLKEKKNYPIAALIDSGTASAAEILAAALHEAGGYPLVGVKSFGKGTVQTEKKFEDGSRIKLTIMKWLTPEGHWIHEKGLKPTVKVKQPDYFYAHPITVEKGESLSYDENGTRVKNAQIMLDGLGFEPGREDGYFGEQTRTAVKAFQRVNGLPVTGKIDVKTASVLDKKILEAVDKMKNDLQLQMALTVLEEDLK
ncbi:MAG TPA: S41 family peptidase [Bacillales bacterium]|nr:S41 family peptidase [Bacillales bacterium]